jgi:hypothetical protein
VRIAASTPYRRLRFQPTVTWRRRSKCCPLPSTLFTQGSMDQKPSDWLVYGGSVSRETVSKITEQVLEEMDRLDELGRWIRGRF